MKPSHFQMRGFTLIELLVVIAIIGLLSTIAVSATRRAIDKSRTARMERDIRILANAVTVARGEGYETMILQTGSGCTYCTGVTPAEKEAALVTALARIGEKSGYVGLEKMTHDPWNVLYRLDENEGESSPTSCNKDNIRSSRGTYYFEYGSSYCINNPSGPTAGWH